MNARSSIGQEVSDEALIAAFGEVESARGGMTLSYFEYTGLAVLKLFQNAHPDVVILEIGLGGRLDAMNAVDPDVSIVAAIGIDHTAFLGNTREAIAVREGAYLPLRAAGYLLGPQSAVNAGWLRCRNRREASAHQPRFQCDGAS